MTLHQLVKPKTTIPGDAVELYLDYDGDWHGAATCSQLYITGKTGIITPRRVWWSHDNMQVYVSADGETIITGSPGGLTEDEETDGQDILDAYPIDEDECDCEVCRHDRNQ